MEIAECFEKFTEDIEYIVFLVYIRCIVRKNQGGES